MKKSIISILALLTATCFAGEIDLSTATISGILPVVNGGTGVNNAVPLVSNYSHVLTGPSTARTITLPDANFTIARTDAAQTFTGTQTFGTIVQLGKTTTYNSHSTVSSGLPSILAEVNSTGLTGNVAATTLLGGSFEGFFRISAYLVTTTAASVSSTMPNAQVVYTDKDSNTSVTLDISPVLGAAGLGQSGLLTANAAGTVFSGSVVIYVKASTTIQYQTVNYASTAAGMTYALRIKLEVL